MTPIECEVLKRYDRYVVRRVGTEEYASRKFLGHWGVVWTVSNKEKAHEFRFKWRAILHARCLEGEYNRLARQMETIKARRAAKEERVWR